MREQESKSQKR